MSQPKTSQRQMSSYDYLLAPLPRREVKTKSISVNHLLRTRKISQLLASDMPKQPAFQGEMAGQNDLLPEYHTTPPPEMAQPPVLQGEMYRYEYLLALLPPRRVVARSVSVNHLLPRQSSHLSPTDARAAHAKIGARSALESPPFWGLRPDIMDSLEMLPVTPSHPPAIHQEHSVYRNTAGCTGLAPSSIVLEEQLARFEPLFADSYSSDSSIKPKSPSQNDSQSTMPPKGPRNLLERFEPFPITRSDPLYRAMEAKYLQQQPEFLSQQKFLSSNDAEICSSPVPVPVVKNTVPEGTQKDMLSTKERMQLLNTPPALPAHPKNRSARAKKNDKGIPQKQKRGGKLGRLDELLASSSTAVSLSDIIGDGSITLSKNQLRKQARRKRREEKVLKDIAGDD